MFYVLGEELDEEAVNVFEDDFSVHNSSSNDDFLRGHCQGDVYT